MSRVPLLSRALKTVAIWAGQSPTPAPPLPSSTPPSSHSTTVPPPMRPTGVLGHALVLVGIAHFASALFFDGAKGASRKKVVKRDADDDEEVLQIPLRNFGNQQYTVHIQMVRQIPSSQTVHVSLSLSANGFPFAGRFLPSVTLWALFPHSDTYTFLISGPTCSMVQLHSRQHPRIHCRRWSRLRRVLSRSS